jgi:hypothetical protein
MSRSALAVGHAVSMLALMTPMLVACASGPVTGRVTMAGTPAGPLSMTWTSGIFGGSGKMSAVMPDGEQFAGTYQVVKPGMSRTSLEASWTGEAPIEAQGDIDDSFWGAARDPAFVRRYANRAIATLRSDGGTTMLCRFNLLAGGAGMRGGGNGECQTSKGAKITAQF